MRTKNPTKKTTAKETTEKKSSVVTPENKKELNTVEVQETAVGSAEMPVAVAELDQTQGAATMIQAVEESNVSTSEKTPAKKTETRKKNVQDKEAVAKETKKTAAKETDKTEASAKKTTKKKTVESVQEETQETDVSEEKKGTAARKTKDKVVLQYNGIEVDTAEFIQRAKDAYMAEGHKESEIKNVEIYIKPEESAVYYVVNGISTGKVSMS